MGCGVLEFGEGEVGAYRRGFEDVEGMKVDLFDVEEGERGKIIKFFSFFKIFFRGGTLPLQVYIAKTSE